MSELQDFGIDNPLKEVERERFVVKTRSAYALLDAKTGTWLDLAVDLDESGKAHTEMKEKKEEYDEKEGKTYNPEVE